MVRISLVSITNELFEFGNSSLPPPILVLVLLHLLSGPTLEVSIRNDEKEKGFWSGQTEDDTLPVNTGRDDRNG